ncbi:MAG: hypothetical protein V4757_00985 [Pseudomonadota bacterium]
MKHRPERPRDAAVDRQDSSLRAAMHAGLPPPPAGELDALQSRIIAQWQMRAAFPADAGPQASSVLGLRGLKRRMVMLLVTTAVLATVATAALWRGTDPAMEELLEPDVLSLISLGQL